MTPTDPTPNIPPQDRQSAAPDSEGSTAVESFSSYREHVQQFCKDFAPELRGSQDTQCLTGEEGLTLLSGGLPEQRPGFTPLLYPTLAALRQRLTRANRVRAMRPAIGAEPSRFTYAPRPHVV